MDGTIILVDGERSMQVMEYDDADALDVEAAGISTVTFSIRVKLSRAS